ncbi:hypothetical protein [Streptomyces sp. KN37]|uniref:hypothetical protein n=1 Tax=Streptomyces sp. KN37 TaxID=3090667 RepID=UPI002A75D5B8|nr:hypothetical protein [Streptomyces sp. KN37]WPO69161.1 hypothetical protein R9806_00160 [Streptomyces sp. KN37]
MYSNKDGGLYPADPEQVRDRLAEHLVLPVHFARGIESMYAAGVRTFIEVGAGSALGGLIEQTLAGRSHLTVSLDQRGHNGVTVFHTALGRLAVAGVRLDFDALWTPYAPSDLSLPKKRSAMTTEIYGTNHNRPYPAPGGTSALPALNSRPATRPGGEPGDPSVPSPAQSSPRAPEETPSGHTAQPPAQQAAGPADSVQSTVMCHWLSAFEQLQRHTGEAHSGYNRAMTESHLAFMRTAEASLNSLASVLDEGAAPPVTFFVAPRWASGLRVRHDFPPCC